MDKRVSETLASIAALKAGAKSYISYGSGPWLDVSQQTLERLQRDLLAEKRWQLDLYKSGKVSFRFDAEARADTTPTVIAELETEIALLAAEA